MSGRTGHALLYRLLVVAAGGGWLLYALGQPHAPLAWGTIAVLTLVSWLVKRSGFRVMVEVTHSLVNVIDAGALLLLGPLGGAIVASLSSILHMQFTAYRRQQRTLEAWLLHPLFDGGVKALLALAGGALYLHAGGHLRPTALPASLLVPLALLFGSWFLADHLLWVGYFWVSGGAERARRFLQQATLASLLVELAPLPFTVPFAVAWVLFDAPLRGLLLLALVLVALVVRGFALALGRTEERIQAVSLLNKFGQSLVLAQMDEGKLAALLHEYAGQLLPDATFALVLLDEDGMTFRPVAPDSAVGREVVELMPLILPLMQERARGRLLSSLSAAVLQEEGQRHPSERPERGGVLDHAADGERRAAGGLCGEAAAPRHPHARRWALAVRARDAGGGRAAKRAPLPPRALARAAAQNHRRGEPHGCLGA